MITTAQALEAATEQIVKSMGLSENQSFEAGNEPYLQEGATALLVFEGQLILGEVEHKTAHMGDSEVTNVSVAGELLYSQTYYYPHPVFGKHPTKIEASLSPVKVYDRD